MHHGLGKVWGTLHPVSLDVERLNAWGCPCGLGQCFSDYRHQNHMGVYWKHSFQGSAQPPESNFLKSAFYQAPLWFVCTPQLGNDWLMGHQPADICSHNCPGAIRACAHCPAVRWHFQGRRVGAGLIPSFVFLPLRGIKAGISEVGVGWAGKQCVILQMRRKNEKALYLYSGGKCVTFKWILFQP